MSPKIPKHVTDLETSSRILKVYPTLFAVSRIFKANPALLGYFLHFWADFGHFWIDLKILGLILDIFILTLVNFVQTWSRHIQGRFQTDLDMVQTQSRHCPDVKTPSRHPSDTFNKLSWHFPDTFRVTNFGSQVCSG